MEDSTNNSQLLGESIGIEKYNNHSKQSPKLRKKVKQQVKKIKKTSKNKYPKKKDHEYKETTSTESGDSESEDSESEDSESEDLSTDTDEETISDDNNQVTQFEKVEKKRRPSNLVRINTDTKWTDSQLNALEQALRDELSQMKTEYENAENRSSNGQGIHSNGTEINGTEINGTEINGTQNINGSQIVTKEILTNKDVNPINTTPPILQTNNKAPQEKEGEGEEMPDKNAKVIFTQKVEILEEKHKLNSNGNGNSIPNSSEVVTAQFKQQDTAYKVGEIDENNQTEGTHTSKQIENKQLLLDKHGKSDENTSECACQCVVL